MPTNPLLLFRYEIVYIYLVPAATGRALVKEFQQLITCHTVLYNSLIFFHFSKYVLSANSVLFLF